jgi:hypothetical protein
MNTTHKNITCLFLVMIACYMQFSCNRDDYSTKKEVSEASAILRIVVVNEGGHLQGKVIEVIKKTKTTVSVGDHLAILNLNTMKAGDEWVVFYRFVNHSNEDQRLDSMIYVKDGKLVGISGMTLQELRSNCAEK